MTMANQKNPFGLTFRECEVMDSLIQHGERKLIARDLDIELSTVNSYMRDILKKMRCANGIAAALKWDRQARNGRHFSGERQSSVWELSARAQ